MTVRLSDRRRARLQALAKECFPLLSPTAAIDHAIDLATQAAQRGEENHWSDWEIKLEELESLVSRRAAEHVNALAEIERRMSELGDAIAALLSTSVKDASGSMPVRAWAEREACGLPKGAFLAKARWHSTTKVDDNSVTVELLVERVAAADLKGAGSRGVPALVRLNLLDRKSPIAHCDAMVGVYLMFRKNKHTSKWLISLHRIEVDGKLGPASASIPT